MLVLSCILWRKCFNFLSSFFKNISRHMFLKCAHHDARKNVFCGFWLCKHFSGFTQLLVPRENKKVLLVTFEITSNMLYKIVNVRLGFSFLIFSCVFVWCKLMHLCQSMHAICIEGIVCIFSMRFPINSLQFCVRPRNRRL